MLAWSLDILIGSVTADWPIKIGHSTTLACQGHNKMIPTQVLKIRFPYVESSYNYVSRIHLTVTCIKWTFSALVWSIARNMKRSVLQMFQKQIFAPSYFVHTRPVNLHPYFVILIYLKTRAYKISISIVRDDKYKKENLCHKQEIKIVLKYSIVYRL